MERTADGRSEGGASDWLREVGRHAMLVADYFSQYAKVRISYRGDFFVSLFTSFAATLFGLGFVIILFQRATQLAGPERIRVWRLYLRAARNGFEKGFISIFQARCEKF